jgi:alpha-galactosidase
MKKGYVPAAAFLTLVWFGINSGNGGLIAYSAPVKEVSKHLEHNSAAPKDLRYVLADQTEWPLPKLEIDSWAKTPPMGFSYWNGFGDNPGPSDALTRQIVDALVNTGLRDAGYVYFLAFDGGWWSQSPDSPRDSAGQPRIDQERWPNGIQAVSDYIHQQGLKVGGYTDIGKLGYCVPPEVGVLGHEQPDADQFAKWGWDYVKIDDHGPGNFYSAAKAIANNSMHRPIVISFSTPVTFPYEFAPRIANMWRVDMDVTLKLGFGDWKNVLREFDGGGRFWWAQAPGRWNDLDILLIGLFGLSDEEAKSHFSMWAIRGAPLLISADIRAPHTQTSGPIPRATLRDLEILKNPEVIAVDQDVLGASGRVVSLDQNGMAEVDAKPLGNFASGEYSVLLLNRNTKPEDITVNWRSLGLLPESVQVRDLWKHADLGSVKSQFTAHGVPAHGVVMLRVKGEVDWSLPREYEAEWSYNRLGGVARVHCLRSSQGQAIGAKDAEDNDARNREANVGRTTASTTVVEGIGGGPENTLQFNELWEGKSGVYQLQIRYASPESREGWIRVNAQSPILVRFPGTGAFTQFATVELRIPLQEGRNTLSIGNPEHLAPNIDKIRISAVAQVVRKSSLQPKH